MKLSDERITELRLQHKHIDSFIRAIEREAHKNGQEDMRERAALVIDERYRGWSDDADAIRALQIEEPSE